MKSKFLPPLADKMNFFEKQTETHPQTCGLTTVGFSVVRVRGSRSGVRCPDHISCHLFPLAVQSAAVSRGLRTVLEEAVVHYKVVGLQPHEMEKVKVLEAVNGFFSRHTYRPPLLAK